MENKPKIRLWSDGCVARRQKFSRTQVRSAFFPPRALPSNKIHEFFKRLTIFSFSEAKLTPGNLMRSILKNSYHTWRPKAMLPPHSARRWTLLSFSIVMSLISPLMEKSSMSVQNENRALRPSWPKRKFNRLGSSMLESISNGWYNHPVLPDAVSKQRLRRGYFQRVALGNLTPTSQNRKWTSVNPRNL